MSAPAPFSQPSVRWWDLRPRCKPQAKQRMTATMILKSRIHAQLVDQHIRMKP